VPGSGWTKLVVITIDEGPRGEEKSAGLLSCISGTGVLLLAGVRGEDIPPAPQFDSGYWFLVDLFRVQYNTPKQQQRSKSVQAS
jgi:hypothetical protein